METSRNHQLDSLRAFAFVAVALSHWLPYRYQYGLPWGTGVQLFFVLSGYLITGILYEYRTTVESSPHLSLLSAFRIFYARRSLRIFPLFYATIAVALILNIENIRQYWPWHVSYLSNFFYVSTGKVDVFRHFWSLAVEEQFYLVWPAAVLLVPRHLLPRVIVTLIMIAPVFRALGASAGYRLNYLPVSCLDSLGIGALLAAIKIGQCSWRSLFADRYTLVLLVTFPVIAGISMVLLGHPKHWLISVGHSAIVVFYAVLVWYAAAGVPGSLGKILNFRPFVFVGQVSYGAYVFHHFFGQVFYTPLVEFLRLPAALSASVVFRLLFLFTCTILLASISWFLFEKPMNSLKRFLYLRPPSAPRAKPGLAVTG